MSDLVHCFACGADIDGYAPHTTQDCVTVILNRISALPKLGEGATEIPEEYRGFVEARNYGMKAVKNRIRKRRSVVKE